MDTKFVQIFKKTFFSKDYILNSLDSLCVGDFRGFQGGLRNPAELSLKF
jgi:hypothetical protein